MTESALVYPITLDPHDRAGMGAAIKAARIEAGLTQRDLETACGVPQGKVSRIERGQSHPPLTVLTAMCGVLGVDLVVTLSRR